MPATWSLSRCLLSARHGAAVPLHKPSSLLCTTPSSVHSEVHEYLMYACHGPGTVLGTKDERANASGQNPTCLELPSRGRWRPHTRAKEIGWPLKGLGGT